MQTREQNKTHVKRYYDQEAAKYIRKYTEDNYEGYPTYILRLNLALQCIRERNIRKILDCGCGSAGPMTKLLQEGYEIKGFDMSPEMVNYGRRELIKAGFDGDLITEGDIEGILPFPGGIFDAVLAFGLFPHLKDEVQSLKKIGSLLNSGGYVYISFRNDLFALYSLNEYSYNFFLSRLINKDLLSEGQLRKSQYFFADKFGYHDHGEGPNKGSELRYRDIYARFRNPLTVEEELFLPGGFKVENMLFHHYHVLPPQFETINPKQFREQSLSLENPSDWKGYFMASTFLVEARKIK